MNQAQIRNIVFFAALLIVFLIGFLPNSLFYVFLKLVLLGVGAGSVFHFFPDFFPFLRDFAYHKPRLVERLDSEENTAESEKEPPLPSGQSSVKDDEDVEHHFENFLGTMFPLIRQTIVANTAVLLMVNYGRKTFYLRHFDSDVEDLIVPQASFDVNRGLPAILLKHRKPILENQLPKNETLLPYYATEEPTARAFMGVPIVFNDAVIGLLCVDSRIEKAFSDEDLILLQNFGSMLGIHLECSNRLFEYEAERKQWEAFDRFRESAKAAHQPSDFWKNCADFLAQEVSADRVLVAERTGNDTVKLRYAYGMEPPLPVQTVFSDREGILGWVFRNRQPIKVNDFLKKENYVPRCGKEEAVEGVLGALMAVPIRQADEVVAVLSVESKRSNAFNEDTRTLLKKIADEAGDYLARPTPKGIAGKSTAPAAFDADSLRKSISEQVASSSVFTLQLLGLDQSPMRNLSKAEQEQFGEEFSQWLESQIPSQASAFRIGQWRWAILWAQSGIAENFTAVQQMLLSLEQSADWLSGELKKPEAFVGLTQFPEGGKTAAALLGGAEKSLLKAQLGEVGSIEIAIPEELLQNGAAGESPDSV